MEHRKKDNRFLAYMIRCLSERLFSDIFIVWLKPCCCLHSVKLQLYWYDFHYKDVSLFGAYEN